MYLKQELFTLPVYPNGFIMLFNGDFLSFGAPVLISAFKGDLLCSIFSFQYSVGFFFWPLQCLSFINLPSDLPVNSISIVSHQAVLFLDETGTPRDKTINCCKSCKTIFSSQAENECYMRLKDVTRRKTDNTAE